MKRRMPEAERVALEAIARPVARFYVTRNEDVEGRLRGVRSMTEVVLDVLTRGCAVQCSPSDSIRMSGQQQWCIAVEWVLREVDRVLGASARYVLVLRLTRAPKREESSFNRIAHDTTEELERRGLLLVVTTEDAEAIYRSALVMFVELLTSRRIGVEPALRSIEAVALTREPRLPERIERSMIAVGKRLQKFIEECGDRRRVRRRAVTTSRRIAAAEAVSLFEEAAARRGVPERATAARR